LYCIHACCPFIAAAVPLCWWLAGVVGRLWLAPGNKYRCKFYPPNALSPLVPNVGVRYIRSSTILSYPERIGGFEGQIIFKLSTVYE
jgi:hypothetical protein